MNAYPIVSINISGGVFSKASIPGKEHLKYTGLPTKDETSDRTVQILFGLLSYILGLFKSF